MGLHFIWLWLYKKFRLLQKKFICNLAAREFVIFESCLSRQIFDVKNRALFVEVA